MTTRKKGNPTPTTQPSRAVCYVRISVDRENETSTETQEERVRAYCAAHGWPIVDVIVEPGRSAYSASRSTRPGFRKVMGIIASGAADVLVVWKLDRAARNTIDMLSLVNELAQYGAQLASVTEHFDTSTPSGVMTLTVLAALAQMESDTKRDRTQAWQDHRRVNGKPPTGPRPFGYQRGGKDNPNVLTIDKAEAVVIRRAAKQVLAGKSFRSVVRALAADGVVGRNGKPMTGRTLQGILLGPTIAACRETSDGVFVESTEWKPILERARWEAVRAVLTDPARRSSPSNARKWLLSGIVRCSRCLDAGADGWMRSMPHRAGTRYACPKCSVSIEAARTEEIVVGDLLGLLDRPAWRRMRQGQPTSVNTAVLEKSMDELRDQFMAGDLDETEFATLAGALRRRHEVASTPPPPLPDVPDLAKAWPKLSLEQRRLVISAATESSDGQTVDTEQPLRRVTRRVDSSRVTNG